MEEKLSKKILEATALHRAFVFNILLVYVAYFLCRLTFVAVNWDMFSDSLTWGKSVEMFLGGLVFDTSAILYSNVLYSLLMLLPVPHRENALYQSVAKCVFFVVNTACVMANLVDCVYFRYTSRRTTATVFSEFHNENNLGAVFGAEMVNRWYLVLAGLLLAAALWKLYSKPKNNLFLSAFRSGCAKDKLGYYAIHTLVFLVFVPLCIGGMRGGLSTAVRPITISNANQYADRPSEAAIVLNTPFSLIRTLNKRVFEIPAYFDDKELDSVYTPLHVPGDSLTKRGKNVVVLIVESFGREYIGAYNTWMDNGKYGGYTPFVDSLIAHSVTYRYSYCNGRKSIDGMPSILSGIPMFVEPFFLTPSSMNEVGGLASELKKDGYYSAFFHGAENGSMGFQAFARATGFQDYFGRTEYNEDSRFGGDKDFDGTWAIWDEPFLQFYATKMDEMPQPFITSVFTASSHHPFVVPEKYKGVYTEGELPIHKCIRYTDNALRQFFNKAKTMPWYGNTLFVLTSDHTNQSCHEYYQTDMGGFCSPIIFFDPSGELGAGMRNAIAQQIDIMPTVLGYIGHGKSYVSFGIDLFSTPEEDTWAVNYLNGVYQYAKGDYLLQFDGSKSIALYRFRTDLLLKHNLLEELPQECGALERELKAVIQSYMERMVHDRLTAE